MTKSSNMENFESRNSEMLVLGVGQMRTGTTSLKLALEHLYEGKCYHMVEVMKNIAHVPLWQKCVDEKCLSKDTANEVFKGYLATVDYPAAIFYRDLLDLYPKAKVIMSVRDPDSWLRSVRQTTLPKQKTQFFQYIVTHLNGFYQFLNMGKSSVEMAFRRSVFELNDDDLLMKCYTTYNEEVMEYIPKDKLLVFQAKDGWEPICRFLDKDIPDIPYPKVNNTKEFQNMHRSNIFKGIMKLFIPFIVLVVCVFYLTFQ